MRTTSTSEGGVEGADFDVRVGNLDATTVSLDVRGLAGVGAARATLDTGEGRILVEGVVGVEPEHVHGIVVPDGEDEDHALLERLADLREAAQRLEGVGVAERGLLRRAPRVGDGVARRATDRRLRVGDDSTALHVEAADLRESSRVSAVGSDELRDNGDLLRGVDGLSGTVEGGVTLAEGVEVATSLKGDGSECRR